MSPFWGDLVARARGLSRRWLLEGRLELVERAPDLGALARLVTEAGYAVAEPPTATRVEQATVAVAADWWEILGRWAGRRRLEVLAVLFEEEKVRCLERLVRGAIQAAPARERLRGIVSSPSLDGRLLRALAEAASVGAMAGLLAEWDDPYAASLEAQAGAVRTDLWELELDLERTYLQRAKRQARRADRAARDHVELLVDHRNLWTALLLARSKGKGSHEPGRLFVPGGRRLPSALFAETLAGAFEDPLRELAERFPGSAVADSLRDGRDLSTLENAARSDRSRAQRRWARLVPLSSAGVIWPSLALSVEQRRIRRSAWRLELGAA